MLLPCAHQKDSLLQHAFGARAHTDTDKSPKGPHVGLEEVLEEEKEQEVSMGNGYACVASEQCEDSDVMKTLMMSGEEGQQPAKSFPSPSTRRISRCVSQVP